MHKDLQLTLVGARTAHRAVYLMAGEERTRATYDLLAEKEIAIVSVGGDWDWDRDLTPWKAPRVMKTGADFGGGADAYLARLRDEISAFEKQTDLQVAWRALAGYSLAGLFSLYALYQTDVFDAAAVVSGSLWFKDWIPFMRGHATKKPRPRVYFSVGDLEKKTRNPWFSTIEDRMREAADILLTQNADVMFTLEAGNHFADENLRVARGIDWLARE